MGPIPDHLFCVLFVDTTYGGDGDEDENNRQEKARIEKEFSVQLEDVDIHPGASLPAFMLTVNFVVPVIAVAITTAFFKGKNIKENLDAWSDIARGLKRFLRGPVYLNRTSATALAIEELRQYIGDQSKIICLTRYSTFDNRFQQLEDATEQEESQRLEVHSCITHVFDFEVDGRKFLAVVEGTDAGVKELGSP
jgi:hypothetical protein